MFWILLFFLSLLSADAPSAIAHFEGGSPSIAGGNVLVSRSLEDYTGYLEGFGYLGLSSPFFGVVGIKGIRYAFLSASKDPVLKADPKTLRRVEPRRMGTGKSPDDVEFDLSL